MTELLTSGELAAEIFLAFVFFGAALFVAYWIEDALSLEGGSL